MENWMANFPDPTDEEKKAAHIRFLAECEAELNEILKKMYHGVPLTRAEQDSVRRVVEDEYKRTEEALFVARGGEIVP